MGMGLKLMTLCIYEFKYMIIKVLATLRCFKKT